MASDNEASCESDPNFAVICAFLEKFGAQCGLPSIDFLELQGSLENTEEVPAHLTQVILKLLRRVKRSVKNDKWEKTLVNVCHNFSSQDAWEIERFGFKKAKLSSKVRALKELLEMQFDYHIKFKNGVNKLTAEELRSHPLGRDKSGHAYWFQSDENYQIRVFKEDLDEETWTLIAKDRDSLVSLIDKLSDGDSKFSSDSAANEDSNSLSEKPVIDTGQTDTDTKLSPEEKKKDANEPQEVVKPKEEDNELKEKRDLSEEETGDSSTDKEKIINEAEQKSRPLLRIKKLTELMADNSKRSKPDHDEDPEDLKLKIKKLNKESVVGEAIEEPVMRIQGEGSGEESEGVYQNYVGVLNKQRDNDLLAVEEHSQSQENPIFGEVIEENVMYFYGEGNGLECLTGNEEKGSSSETRSNSEISAEDKCIQNSSVASSIKDNLSDFKDNNIKAKEVPRIKLGTIIDTKTDNSINRLPGSPSKKSRWDVETLEAKPSNSELESSEVITAKEKDLTNKFEQVDGPTENIVENKTPPSTPKKSTFFFGSGSFKSNSVSPSLTIGFGQNSPDKCTSGASNETSDEQYVKVNDESEIMCKNTKTEEQGKNEHSISKDVNEVNDIETGIDKTVESADTCNEIHNKSNSNKDIVTTDLDDSEKVEEDSSGQNMKLIDKNVIDEITHEKEEKENVSIKVGLIEDGCAETNKNKNGQEEKNSDQQIDKIEPECIKKIAYICGNKISDDDQEDAMSNSEIKIDSKFDRNKHVDVDNVRKQIYKNDESSKDKLLEKNFDLNETNTLSSLNEESNLTTNLHLATELTTEEKKDKELEDNKPNNDECYTENQNTKDIAVEHKTCLSSDNSTCETRSQSKDANVQARKPLLSLRSVRSKKVATSNSTDSDYQKVFISSMENSKDIESIGFNPRRGRPKKQVDEKPSESVLSQISKKAKATEEINEEEEEEFVSSRGGRRSIRAKTTNSTSTTTSTADIADQKAKDKEGSNGLTPDSSHVNSPVSVSESVIILPDSLESTIDYPLKDPLANSDEEATPPPQKPMNLLSLSLDYNESSTPPPIPIIPSRRTLRKRGREASPEVKEVTASAGKKIKLKGKRQIDTKLRKSIEQKKQEQVSSSDEVLDISDEEKPVAKSRKKGKQAKTKKKEKVIEISDEDSGTPVPKPKKKYNKNSRLLANLGITDDKPFESVGVRQSRRLAQIKIKEQAEGKKGESKSPKEEITKKKKAEEKEYKNEKRKKIKEQKSRKEETPEPEPEDIKKTKKKKYKSPSKIFDEKKPWMSSSESSEIEEELEEEEEVIEEDDLPLEFKSDHEFSPESDLEEDGKSQPLKRARTARKNYEECDEEDTGDDCPCEKCGKSDHPEWVLLCDKCDKGWHCSCLRPPLLVIPEGDWFCPPCQHIRLVENLQAKLVEYDKKLSKKEIEDRRKERLAYVGISLNNVLPSREHGPKKKRHLSTVETESSSGNSRGGSSGSESESDSDEPIYQLRQRRQAKSYKFNEYDDLIKSAIQDEIEEKGLDTAYQSRGKDIATIVKAEKEERKEKEDQQKKESEEVLPEEKPPVVPPEGKEKEYSDDDVIKPPLKKIRKKTRKINNLDVSSEEDDERDEDFKGTSSESEEEEPEEEEDSEEDSDFVRGGKRRKNLRPVRRSTRARVSRYDTDFINDDDDDDDAPRKKKKKKYWSETESEESDKSWGRRKKGRSALTTRKKSKKKKKSILDELSDLEPLKKKKPKIKYGGLTSSDEDTVRRRRTRGKKTTYVDTLGSDSEEESQRKRNPRRIDSDEDDEDFIANEEEKDSEVQDEEDEQEEVSERRLLVVPKIYIKKPPVSKEVERPKEKVQPPPENDSREEAKDDATAKTVENTSNPKLEEPKPLEEKSQSVNEKLNIDEKLEQIEKPLEKCNLVEEKQKPDEAKVTHSEEKQGESVRKLLHKSLENEELGDEEDGDDEYGNPIEKINKNLEEMDSDEMEKMMEEEEFANKQLQLVALQLEKEKKRKAEEAKRLEIIEKSIAPTVPAKRGRKPKVKELLQLPKNVIHEPIVSNVKALIRNDTDNDELSEPPGVALPLFEELASRKIEDEPPKRGRGRGKGKKTLEETLANLGGRKNLTNKMPENTPQNAGCNIEIAAPPQPFSQAAPTPSVITRMLQSKPGQTTTYPVGTIRPKQFATMPDDDDDSPSSRSRGSSPSTGPGHNPGAPPGQFMPGGPRGPMGTPFRSMHHQAVNHYPRGPLPPHPIRGPGPPGMLPHIYHSHRSLDPSPSGGGPINMSEANPPQVAPPPTSSPGNKMEPHNYSRTPVSRFPPIGSPPNIPITPPRPMHMLPHMQQTRQPNLNPYPSHPQPTNYYGGYPPESIANEDTMPPTVFQNSPYPEQYPAEIGAEPSENSNSKSYGDESGGEFGGLVSYFSSQREDDLES